MADIIKFPSSVKKIGDIINDDYLLDLLYKAAMNPKSEITMDDYKKYKETGSFATGGMANINDMIRPVGYENGGDVKKNIITRRLASTRAQKPFEDFLKDIGFTKKDEVTKKIRGAKGDWAKYLTSKNIKVGSVEATNELNRLLKAAGKPLYVDIASAGKNFSEEIISAVTGTQPGESGARKARNAANSKIVEIKKIATQAEGSNSTKAKQKLLTTLFEKSFPVLKTVPKYAALLSTAVASKAFGYIPIATEMGDAELPEEGTPEYEELMKGLKGEDKGLEIDIPLEYGKFKGGGMMNMDEMTRPLSYAAGGPIPQEPEQTGILSGLMSLIKNIRENAFAPEQREDGGAEYNKIFNFLWKQGYDSQQIDDIINRRVNQEDLVPSHDGSEEFKG